MGPGHVEADSAPRAHARGTVGAVGGQVTAVLAHDVACAIAGGEDIVITGARAARCMFAESGGNVGGGGGGGGGGEVERIRHAHTPHESGMTGNKKGRTDCVLIGLTKAS